jgi:DNA primase
MAAVDVDAIRAAHPLANIVARSGVTLESRAHGYLCICPFCKYGDDRDRPIMSIYPESGRFKCHYGPCTSNALSKGNPNGGGDVIRYIELLHNTGFRDAAFRLQHSHAFGGAATDPFLPVVPPRPRPTFTTSTDRAYAINQMAWQYFTAPDRVLTAEQYMVAERGINVSPIRVANGGQPVAGYAPNNWDGLAQHLIAHGVTQQELSDTGLARVNAAGRLNDIFRGRVIFPVRDDEGRVSGFIGRDLILTESARKAAFTEAHAATAHGSKANYVPAKYINSPDTPTFTKSDFLYRPTHHTLDKDANVIVVEGVMDALAIAAAAAQRGELGRFAPVTESGCAGSTRNVKRALAMHPKPPVICLDGDAAGVAGNQRWVAHAATLRRPVLVTQLPGCDPAEWIGDHGHDGLAAFDRRGALDADPNDVRPHLAAAEMVRHHFACSDPAPRAMLDALATVAAALCNDRRAAEFVELASKEVNTLGKDSNGTFRNALTNALTAHLRKTKSAELALNLRADFGTTSHSRGLEPTL